MPYMKRYSNISMNGNAGPFTLPSHTTTAISYFSNGIPVYGARCVVFRIKMTGANVPTAWQINVGNNAPRSATFSAITGAGYPSIVGNLGMPFNAGNGNVVSAAANANQGRFHHHFVQFGLTGKVGATPDNDLTNVTVEADVWYDGDDDAIAVEAGQQNYAVLTT